MKIIKLSQATIIDDREYLKGEIVRVSDDFDENVERVISTSKEQEMIKKEKKDKIDKAKVKDKDNGSNSAE